MQTQCSLLLMWAVAISAQVGYHVLLQPSIGYVYPPQLSPEERGYYDGSPVLHLGNPNPGEYAGEDDAFPRTADCLLVAASTSSVSGELRLSQPGHGNPVLISGTVYGLTPGKHGFHMHRDPSTEDNCKGAGPHFNPTNKTHGAPGDENSHAGDYGNIVADKTGVADVSVLADRVSLEPGDQGFAVGRAMVVHAGVDDLGKGGNEESLKTGNAGGRLACCVIKQRHYGSP